MKRLLAVCAVALLFVAHAASALAAPEGQTFRLYEGVTAYVVNPDGRDFTVSLDVRDINQFSNGPREIMFKVYDPDGKPVVREFIPDDGCVTNSVVERIGGWDHDLQSFTQPFTLGSVPRFSWSQWSDPARLKTLAPRTFDRPIKGGKKGLYRVVLAGTIDHYVTLRLSPDLKYGVAGHPTFFHGSGSTLKKAFIYVPKNTVGLYFAIAEPDQPRNRRFKLTAPDGSVIFDGEARGGFYSPAGNDPAWQKAMAPFAAHAYDGKLITLEVSDGPNDYLFKATLQQPMKDTFADYVGMGISPVFCPDEATANAIQNGTVVVDNEVFLHPYQVKFHKWCLANPIAGDEKTQALRKNINTIGSKFRLFEVGDERGSQSWSNLAYATGYYGAKLFKPSWLMMQNPDCPAEVKELIKEGLIMAADRLSVATHMEKVNGNSFTQINVQLWYASRATGDAILKERFETFWKRWTTEGWGKGSGISRSGDSQEHFAHDMHYGSYLMDNWKTAGNTWVTEGGIIGDAKDDDRFAKVLDRYKNLYSYLYCRENNGGVIAANPWSARTAASASSGTANWEDAAHAWKGLPGPAFTVSVNDGNEWFAARRPSYYALTFHGRLAPDWLTNIFDGQLGFGGGIICQVTVPGKGPVLTSTLKHEYGEGMHSSEWRDYHIHSLVAERWDDVPVITSISEHEDAKLAGTTVTGSGEVRGGHVKVTRSFTFNDDSIECTAKLEPSEYNQVMSLWRPRRYSEMKSAVEMIPYVGKTPDGKPTAVTAADGKPLTADFAPTASVRIDRGGFGVNIVFEKPTAVKLGQNETVVVQVLAPAAKPVPAETIGVKYKIVPFGQ